MPRPVRGLVLAVLLLAGCSGGESAEYDEEFQEEFLDACEGAHGRPEAPEVCGCWYDQVEADVDFDDLPSIDDLTGDDFDVAPTRLPGSEMARPMQLLAECVRQVGQQPLIGTAVPPPTLPRPPTTTTAPTTTVPA